MIDQNPLRWHNAKSLAFDNEGGMYVTFSAPTNVCEDWNTAGDSTSVNVKGEYPCSQLNSRFSHLPHNLLLDHVQDHIYLFEMK